MRKIIQSRPFRQSDDWRDRAPTPLAYVIDHEHGADLAAIERQARQAFGRRINPPQLAQ